MWWLEMNKVEFDRIWTTAKINMYSKSKWQVIEKWVMEYQPLWKAYVIYKSKTQHEIQGNWWMNMEAHFNS